MTLFLDPSRAKQFECVICSEIYKEPVQIGCEEHIFCKQCVDALISEHGPLFYCPLCRTKCCAKSVTRVKFIDRQIHDLKVKCPNMIGNKNNIGNTNNNKNHNKNVLRRRSMRLKEKTEKIGQKRERSFADQDEENININNNKRRKLNQDELCEWKGLYSDLSNHIKTCPLQSTLCKYCSDSFLQRELEQHYEQCARFPMKCIQCDKTGICRNRMASHIGGWCPMTLIFCAKCKQSIIKKDEQFHLRNECPEALIKCTFYQFGCREKLKRKDEKNHIENATFTHNHLVHIATHQLKLVDTVNALKNENKGLNARINALENKQKQIQTTMDAKIAKLPQYYADYKFVYVDSDGNLCRYKNGKHTMELL